MSEFSKPTKFSATSRCAVKIRDNYYTIEVSEEREVTSPEVDTEKEFEKLFDKLNAVVDNQIEEIYNTQKS